MPRYVFLPIAIKGPFQTPAIMVALFLGDALCTHPFSAITLPAAPPAAYLLPMRKLVLFSAGFAAGTLAAVSLLPAAVFLPLGAFCVLAGLVCASAKHRIPALILLGLAAAMAWVPAYDDLIRSPATALEYQTATLTLTTADFPQPTARGVSVTVSLGPGARVLLYLEPEYAELQPGDTLKLTAYFRPAAQIRGEENSRYTAQGIFLTATPKGAISVARPHQVPLQYLPVLWGRTLGEAVKTALPSDAAPLAAAVLTGDKSGLSDVAYTALQRSGLAHAVAVSGMHVSFLAGVLCLLLGRHRRRTALIALPLLLVFMLLTGSTPSVVRAVLMQSLVLLAPILGREGDGATSLFFALLVLLLQNPYAAQSLSLQLSFLSVAGILLFTEPMFERLWAALPLKNRLTRAVLASLCTSLGALSLTTPLLARSFGTVSLIAPLTNLLALWAVSLVFLGSLAAACLALLSPALGQLVGLLTAPLIRYLNWLAPALARLPYAAVSLTDGYLAAWGFFAYGLILLTLAWRGGGRRPIVPVCCCLITLCGALLCTRFSYECGSLTVTALDVGQGQSVVLRAGDQTALVDCGGSTGRSAGDLAADYLADRGRDWLDLLILTHFHADHAGGVPALLERIPVSALVVPEGESDDPLQAEILALAAEKEIAVVTVDRDLILSLGTANLTLYAPLGAGETNEEGLSVLCRTDGFSALFTGDMDEHIERRLVKYGNLPDVDLLMAGHHGSQTATSSLLLETVKPELVLFSTGYNTYGHPAPKTLTRVALAGGAVYRTDMQGNITITVR